MRQIDFSNFVCTRSPPPPPHTHTHTHTVECKKRKKTRNKERKRKQKIGKASLFSLFCTPSLSSPLSLFSTPNAQRTTLTSLSAFSLNTLRAKQTKRQGGARLPRHRTLDLSPKVDLERLAQRARVLRVVELSPVLADAGDGVPHPPLVLERNKDRHNQLLREVVNGESGAVQCSLSSAAGVVCLGHRSAASTLLGERAGSLLFCLCNLAEGHAKTPLRRSRGRKEVKRA